MMVRSSPGPFHRKRFSTSFQQSFHFGVGREDSWFWPTKTDTAATPRERQNSSRENRSGSGIRSMDHFAGLDGFKRIGLEAGPLSQWLFSGSRRSRVTRGLR
jgi:hypothetical protein